VPQKGRPEEVQDRAQVLVVERGHSNTDTNHFCDTCRSTAPVSKMTDRACHLGLRLAATAGPRHLLGLGPSSGELELPGLFFPAAGASCDEPWAALRIGDAGTAWLQAAAKTSAAERERYGAIVER
jgi:hypothetical protein